jgi:hemoglobin
MRQLVLAGVVLAAACGAKSAGDTAGAKSLYDRLGGKPAITLVVDDFVTNIANDSRINVRFANTDIPAFKAKLVDQICEATGGPCKYTGKSMRESHTGLRISEAEFTALVEDLQKSLNKYKVGEKEQGELVGALGAMKPDIVNL